MSNSYFEFKRFTIRQDRCAMKVGTDGVLLGAWVKPEGARRILDVGTGSGLIALMLAQKSEAEIEAVEIDGDAAGQAGQNVEDSPWSDRVCVHNISFQEYCMLCKNKFDLIVSNPPYFISGPESPDKNRATARHNNKLRLSEFVKGCVGLLSPKGKIGLVLPYTLREELVTVVAENNLWIEAETKILSTPLKPPVRLLFVLSREFPEKQMLDRIVIETETRHRYSEEFIRLTKDYYKTLPGFI